MRYGPNYNTIRGNMIANNTYGINVEGSSNNEIIGNIIMNKHYVGIDIHSYSMDNVLYHNNFVNNENQVLFELSTSSAEWNKRM